MANRSIRPTRRGVLVAAAASMALARAARAEPASPEPGKDPLPPNLESAIERGLGFAQKQQRFAGSFDAAGPTGAVTGLALLAMLSAGHVPEVGKYGNSVRAAINSLLAIDPEGGFLGKEVRGNERMQAHCVATVALAQAHGLEVEERQRRRVREALEKSLRVLFSAQDVRKDPAAEGGWRFSPSHAESDLSVTTWGVMALAACADAGIEAPRERLERAQAYVVRCFRPRDRGFAYTPNDAASAWMTAAAVVSLHLLGAEQRAEMPAAVEYLTEKPVRAEQRNYHEALYLATQAAYLAGGRAWSVLWKNAADQLIPAQNKDGSWNAKQGEPSGEGERGRVYSTAMALMSLCVPLRLLPVFQR